MEHSSSLRSTKLPSGRKILIGLPLLLVAALFGVVCGLFMQWRSFLNTPLNAGLEPILFKVSRHETIHQLANSLQRKNLIKNPKLFVWLGLVTGKSHQIRAGEYVIKPGMTPPEFLEEIILGQVALYGVTFIEGWRFSQVLSTLSTNSHLILVNDFPSLTFLTQYKNPEGLFFPETYLFPRDTSSDTLLKVAHEKLEQVLSEEWAHRADHLPYQTPYEALIAASLIEKEAALDAERPLIAGVIVRRLVTNMPLQIDATVIYALGDRYSGTLHRSELKYESPYNTYLHKGLPPTPIALVSRASLHAALHPDPGKSLFYMAKGDRGHIFSDTFLAHRQAVVKYLKVSTSPIGKRGS